MKWDEEEVSLFELALLFVALVLLLKVWRLW